MERRGVAALRAATHAGALVPLIVLVVQFATDGLGANPIEAIQIHTGKTALNILLVSLACTPAYLLSGFAPLLSLRKPLGLYAFLYVGLHFANLVAVDYGFNLTLISRDALFVKRFMLAGVGAFVLLLPLAITSIDGLSGRLRGGWQYLRMLTYPAAVLAVVHFIWQAKIDLRLPLVYAGILAALLAFRVPPVSGFFRRRLEWRGRVS